jgi:hypothetical protein
VCLRQKKRKPRKPRTQTIYNALGCSDRKPRDANRDPQSHPFGLFNIDPFYVRQNYSIANFVFSFLVALQTPNIINRILYRVCVDGAGATSKNSVWKYSILTNLIRSFSFLSDLIFTRSLVVLGVRKNYQIPTHFSGPPCLHFWGFWGPLRRLKRK